MMELPAGWITVELRELGGWSGGGTPSRSKAEYWGGSIPWVSPKDMKREQISDAQDHITSQAVEHSATQIIAPYSVLVVTRSGILRRYLPVAVNETKVAINQDLKALTPFLGVDAEYLACQLRANGSDILRACAKSGTTVDSVDSAKLKAYPVALAPTAEQRRIVAKLDSLFARTRSAREELARIPRLVEHYKQAILAAAFRGELTADWRATRREGGSEDSASDFLRARRTARAALQASDGTTRDAKTSMVERDSDLQDAIARRTANEPLPQGWQWVAVGELFSVFVGATPSRKRSEYWNGDIAWVSSGEVAFRRISATEEQITAEGLRNASTRVHPAGTVLLGIIGEGKTRGQTAILDIRACNNQNCAAIRVSEAEFSPEFLFWYFFAQYEHTRRVGAGNNQPALNKTRVQRLLMPLPPPAEASRVAELIGDALRWVESLREHGEKAATLLDHLDQANLAKAFRGELVPQDPNDEPASKLLERIRAARAAESKPKGQLGKAAAG